MLFELHQDKTFIIVFNHVVIVVKLCCVEGLMEDRCTSNEHSR